MTESASVHNPEKLPEITRIIVALVIISADQKILLGRKDPAMGGVYPDVWHLPGGGVDEGETKKQAAVREGREETGLDLEEDALTELPFTGEGGAPKMLPSGERVWANMSFNRFEVHLSQPAVEVLVQPLADLVELRWFGPEELAELPQPPGGREFFVEAGYIPDAS